MWHSSLLHSDRHYLHILIHCSQTVIAVQFLFTKSWSIYHELHFATTKLQIKHKALITSTLQISNTFWTLYTMRTIRWYRYCVIGCLLLTPHKDIHKNNKQADTRNQHVVCGSKSRAKKKKKINRNKRRIYSIHRWQLQRKMHTAGGGVPSAYSLGYGLNSRS